MLQLCVQSILENSDYAHQIIIHVSDGTDGTLEWVEASGLDFSHSVENAGVCYAVNAMAAMAKTDWLLYLNDDMYVCKNWDRELKKVMDSLSHYQWYISGTMIEPVASNNACVISPHPFGRTPAEFKRSELDAFAATVHKSDWSGACWPPSLVHKTLFDQVGGYSVEFSPGMYSDPDFAMKLWMAGVRHFQGIGSSLVYHFQSRSTGRVKRNNGRKQFAAKWGLPSSYFYRKVLKMGHKYRPGQTLAMKKNAAYLFAKIKAWWIAMK